jgi:hypothetical protein
LSEATPPDKVQLKPASRQGCQLTQGSAWARNPGL